MAPANKSTVLIIGCGVAGPVLALLLQKKGYHPIVFEKVGRLGDAGASLMLQPNGMKVLGLLGLTDEIFKLTKPLERYEEYDFTGQSLGSSSFPSQFTKRYGYAGAGVRRTQLNLLLRDLVLSQGVDVREGWGLESFEEHENAVTAYFTDGRSATGSFLIGCDGIKAQSRQAMLSRKGMEEAQPTYTGLSQTAGISLTPTALNQTASMRNIYGDGVHIISYPVSPSHTSWAITRREASQTKETWRLYNAEEILQLKEELNMALAGCDASFLEMLGSVERITRYGLFDREGLPAQAWYSDRSVLVGDAAHPTSPHLGQGANQALEDCYHLSQLIPSYLEGDECDKSRLRDAFRNYAELRQPRTAMLVKGARAQGERRVTSGTEACKKRDEAVAESWRDEEGVIARNDAMLKDHPFPKSM